MFKPITIFIQNIYIVKNRLYILIRVYRGKKQKIKVGSIARNKEEIKLLQKYGFQFIVYQNDTGIINETLSNF